MTAAKTSGRFILNGIDTALLFMMIFFVFCFVSCTQVAQQKKQQEMMQRVGTPEEVGGTALFLASDLSSYVTEDRILVGGGASQVVRLK